MYFVAPNGSNSGTGSAVYPWRTLEYACTRTVSGDVIFIRSGTHNGMGSISRLPSGVSVEGDGETSVLVETTILLEGGIGNQHITNVKFDGNNKDVFTAIIIDNRHDVILSNCKFVNFKTGNRFYADIAYEYAIELRHSYNIEISNNIIEAGIRSFYDNRNLNIHHNLIGKSSISLEPEVGIYLCDVDNIRIWNNKFKNLATFIEVSAYGITKVKDVYIYCNLMTTAGISDITTWGYGSGIRFGGLTTGTVRNINVMNNTIVGNPGNRYTMIGIWLPTLGDGTIINIVNNIIHGFQYASIFAAGPDPRMDSVYIENNILFMNAITGRSYAPNNLPYFTNVPLPLILVQQNNIEEDPLFIGNNDFHLQNTSPGVSAGLYIPWIEFYHDDDTYFGTPNIGAYNGYPTIIIDPVVEDELIIYPIPATDNISIMIKDPKFQPNRLDIYDYNGKILISQKIDTDFISHLPINLKTGFYILKITNSRQNILIGKIIVK